MGFPGVGSSFGALAMKFIICLIACLRGNDLDEQVDSGAFVGVFPSLEHLLINILHEGDPNNRGTLSLLAGYLEATVLART